MSREDRMNVLGHWDDWKCPRCDSVNGPKTGLLCDVCVSDGEHGEVVELVRADTYRGAVEAIAAHRAAIERIGTVSVADDESRARAQAKHEADLALWRYGGSSS